MKVNRFVIGGIVAVGLLAGGTAAGATIDAGPVDSGGVIHGCWTNAELGGSHVFLLQNAGTPCPKGTSSIAWNQTGPQGSAGPQGPAGATGSPGAGATVAAVAPGNSNCLNGGASVSDGTGNNAFVCNGANGTNGTNGTDGRTMLSGATPPTTSAGGSPGDFYLDTTTETLYGPLTSSGWPTTGTSLIGPAGPSGGAGPDCSSPGVGANLVGCDFTGKSLAGDDLNGADLTVGNLGGANFGGASLIGARLTAANLEFATLAGANLSYADLTGANLGFDDLTGVTVVGANLQHVNLDDTTCPDGSNSNNDGFTCTGHGF
jgi:Pentapeptide repeats (8 copies)